MSETNTVRIDNLDSTNEQAQKYLILEMLRRGAISKVEARTQLGLERVEFLELLHRHRIPIANYPPDEFDAEVDAVKSLLSK
ncbi:UPF0175 family protein [Candidatus Poribacteria bacterium]|nr:UPF0175 family protein [Candidatus Poribacteria bacterium]